MKKIILLGLVSLILITSITACNLSNSPNQTKEPIKIGALFPLTGGLTIYGEPAQKTAQLAVDEINAAGGINGRIVEINFQDHKCNPQDAISAYQQLKNVEGIKLYTSAACSGTVISLAPQMEKDEVLLGTMITATKISGISESVYRNYASDTDSAKMFAKYIESKQLKNLAIIYEETDYAKGLKILVEQNLKNQGIQINSEGFTSNSTDMRTQLTKLKATNPDVLFISAQTESSADKVLKQMKELSFRPKELLVNENIYRSKNLNENYADWLENAISVDYVLLENDKKEHVLQAYEDKYGTSCPQLNICLTVYDNIYMLAQAASQDKATVKDYLAEIEYSGASGEIKFNDQNDRKNTDYTLFRIVDGQGVKVNLQ